METYKRQERMETRQAVKAAKSAARLRVAKSGGTVAMEDKAARNAELNVMRTSSRDRKKAKLTVALEDILGTTQEPYVERDRSVEVLDLISHALSLLSPSQRRAVVEVAVKEATYAEAAAAIGISVSAIRSHLTRARERLPQL